MGPGEIDLVKSIRARQSTAPLAPLLASTPAAAAAAAAGGPASVVGLQQFMQNLMFLLMDLVSPGGRRGTRRGVPEARHLDEPPPVADGTPEEPGGGAAGGRRLPMGEGRQRAVMRQERRIGADIAHMFDALEQWALRDGVRLRILSGYRSYEDRQMLDGRYGEGRTGVSGVDLHEAGYAIDFANTPGAYAWLRKNAPRLGFACPDPEEPWHWVAGPR